MDDANVAEAGDNSPEHTFEQLTDEDLLVLIRNAEATRVLAARALLNRKVEFSVLLDLAIAVPAIQQDFLSKIISNATTNRQLLAVMGNCPNLQAEAALLILANHPMPDELREMKTFLAVSKMHMSGTADTCQAIREKVERVLRQ